MPAIRDFVTNYTPAATGTTLVLDAPVLLQNDLLLAVICADTGTATWSSSGWSVLFNQTNTSQLAVLYKIAGGSEPASYTFTASATESFDGGIISIRDVDTTNPFGSTPLYTTSNISTARVQMNTITTNVANSLIIYAVSASSQNSSPTFIEGPVNYLYTVQGISEASGVGWGFQVATGTTPAVYTNSPSAGTGIKATIQIAAPSGGATVIPPHGPSDSSIYLDPIMGTTAYDGNTAFAATATTYFGTSLGGRTLANGTAAAGADYGINPTHSVGNLTTSAANNWSGATKVVSAGRTYDITGKNIIVHTGPSTPLQYQRLTAAAAQKGVAFGMATSAGNWKIWHVHGAGTSFVHGRDIPVVINSGNTTGVIGSAGTFNPASVQIYGFFVASQSTTALYQFYQLWILDTFVIAGGNSTEPVDLTGFVKVIQGHEHRGALVQGKNQVLVFMPLQFGDGGTNPIYLDLNATALEFPTQYNADAKRVNYCSTDNIAGLKYYAGASDVIKHRNSVISSDSRYFWGLHASSSTSATYDFSGLAVIGAGTITLNRAITISELTINDYTTIDASNATLSSCTILGAPAANDSITLTSATVSGCSISVTGVTAANRWCSVASPAIFSNCTFTGSASTGHAMRITSTTGSPFALVGNTFTSFGADGTNSAAIFNDSGGAIIINITGTTSVPTIRNGTGASTTINRPVDVTITVKDESTAAVSSAQVAVYKTSDMTQLMNTTSNGSGVATASFNYVSDTAVTIRVRKSSTGASKYIPVNTSGTITSTGLSATITFVAETIAAATITDATIATDFAINTTTKTVRHTTGSTVYSANQLYTWLMDEFDASTFMDDTTPISAQTPTEYTLTNGWFMDNNSFKYLNGGAVQTNGQASYNIHILTVTGGTYVVPVSGDITKTVVAGATSIGPLLDFEVITVGVSSKWYVRDTRAVPAVITSTTAMTITTGTGSGNNSANSLTGENIWSNIFTLGTLVSGTTLDVYQNDGQITPWWTAGQIDILVKVKEAGTEIDSGNLTILARKYSTLYDHFVIDASTGRNPVPLAAFTDSNNQTAEGTVGIAPYTTITISTFGAKSQDLSNGNGARPYEVEINCATLTLAQVYEYLKYVTRTGSGSTLNGVNGEFYTAVGDIRLDYTGETSGPFVQGNAITSSAGGSGYIVSLIDNGTTGTLVIRNVHGTFAASNTLTSTGTTATINGTPDPITQSKQAPFGTFAGGNFFGARGVWIYNMASADATKYSLKDSTNTTQNPPNVVPIIITVKDELGAVVQNARVAVYKTSDMTELNNELTNASGIAETIYTYPGSDVPVTIRVRMSSTGASKYVPVNTSGTITSTGLSATITFVAETIAAATITDATISTDFTINTTTKTVKHTTGSTVYSANQLYTWLMDEFDASTFMDDTTPISAQTPTEYTLTSGWFMDNNSFKYLNGGAIQTNGQASYNIHILTVTGGTYADPISGDITKTVVAGATSIGPLVDFEIISAGVSSKWYVRDTRAVPAVITSTTTMTITTGTGSGNNSVNSLTGENIWSNIFTLGTLVSGTTMDVYQNDVQITPWWTSGQIDILVKVKEAGTEIDSGNLTVLARKYSTLYDYSIIDASSGRNPVPLAAFTDSNNQTAEGTVGAVPYTNITFDFGYYSGNLNNGQGAQPYDVVINCATLTLAQVYEYLKYVTRTGSATTFTGYGSIPGEFYTAVGDIRFDYDTEGGGGTAFSEGELITGTGGGTPTGYLVSLFDGGTTGTMVLRNVHGTFTDNQVLTGGTTGRTALVNGTITAITPSKQAPFGTFAGGKFFGARGVWITNYAGADGNNFTLIDSAGVSREPPSTISITVTSIVSGDRVSVFRTTGDNEIIDKAYISSHATANSAATTLWQATATIPSDTPATGTIRLRKAVTNVEESKDYTSWAGDTFTLSTAHSGGYGTGDSAYVPYIDVTAAGTTASVSITYRANQYIVSRIRKKGIIPFSVTGQITNANLTITAIRTTDSIVA